MADIETASSSSSSAARDVVFDVDPLDVDEVIAARVRAGEIIVPPFPSVLVALNDAAESGASMAALARIVGSDPTLAAGVLRLVNSPLFLGAGGPTYSLQSALQRLGLKGLRKLVIDSTLATSALQKGALFDLRRRVWRECVVSSLVAEAIAGVYGVDTAVAQLAGLMHDFGKIVTIACIEEALRGATDLQSAEPYWLHVVERHHCDIGAQIADEWRLPEPIPSIIAGHHQHLTAGRVPLLDIVHTCDAVVDAFGDSVDDVELEYLVALDVIRSREEAVLIRKSLDRLPSLLSALGEGPPPAPERKKPAAAAAATAPVPVATFLVSPARVNIPTTILGHGRATGLTAVALSRQGLALATPEPLPEGWVTHLELEGPRGPFRIWVTVLCTRRHGDGLHITEAKPLSLRGSAADEWYRFVDAFRMC